MERLIFVGIIGLLILTIGYLVSVDNPYEREIAMIQSEGDRLDAEIQTAQTQQDCERLASKYLGELILEAANPGPQLKPDLEGLFWPNDPSAYPTQARQSLEEMLDISGRAVAAAGDATLYLVACLRHLQEIGVRDLDGSVADIWQRVVTQTH